MYTHADTDHPPSSHVFVFGSNLAGRHGAGAAKYARLAHGAHYGISSGYMSANDRHCYAIPTKDAQLRTLPISAILPYIEAFITFTHDHPELKFYLTRIGCGLAGYTDAQIAPLFKTVNLENTSVPERWVPYIS